MPYCNKASSACLLQERRRWSWEREWCSVIVELDCSKFGIHGVVMSIFSVSIFLFCRSSNAIDITRWVKIFAKLKYYLPSRVCSIPVTCCYYVFVVCLQSGGGWGQTITAKEEVALCGQEKHGAGAVALVCIVWVRCLWVKHVGLINHSTCDFLPCSNYARCYYKRRYYIPTDSSPDPEEHECRPEDPRVLPQ